MQFAIKLGLYLLPVLGCGLAGTALAASGPAALTVAAEEACVRVGDSLTVTADFETPPDPAWSLRWSASAGTVSGAGVTATCVPPDEPGWAVVTLSVFDAGESLLVERHCAVLVYRQFAIIKADDYVSWTGAVSASWLDYLEYMNEERRQIGRAHV